MKPTPNPPGRARAVRPPAVYARRRPRGDMRATVDTRLARVFVHVDILYHATLGARTDLSCVSRPTPVEQIASTGAGPGRARVREEKQVNYVPRARAPRRTPHAARRHASVIPRTLARPAVSGVAPHTGLLRGACPQPISRHRTVASSSIYRRAPRRIHPEHSRRARLACIHGYLISACVPTHLATKTCSSTFNPAQKDLRMTLEYLRMTLEDL